MIVVIVLHSLPKFLLLSSSVVSIDRYVGRASLFVYYEMNWWMIADSNQSFAVGSIGYKTQS